MTEGGLGADEIRTWLAGFGRLIEANCDHLTALDAAIGDADHGINMRRGVRRAHLEGAGSPAELLDSYGRTLMMTVGGAAGPLYGTAFRSMASELPAGRTVALEALARGLHAGLKAIQSLGAAEVGDKTMVDAFAPAVVAVETALRDRASPAEALHAAAAAAEQGMRDTIPLRARKGRASYLGHRSEGHQDPGATSTWYLFQALAGGGIR